jgi:CheY-like chemotaxis protein
MPVRAFSAWLKRRLAGADVDAARAKARAAETRLRDAIDAIPEGVVFLDAEGRYVLWNRRYAEIYHRSADLFRPGARLSDTLREGVRRGDYPDAVGREGAWLAARMARLAAATGERHEQQLADGRWLMIEERRTSDGGVIGLRVDITALKRQAEALETALNHAEAAQRAKAEFLADMSHELRTPLNGVVGLSAALEETGLDARQAELVAGLRAAGGELQRLIANLVDYDETEPGEPQVMEMARTRARSFRVLAADDNPTNRKVIELMLQAAKVDVTLAEDGAQALEAWRAGGFDAVLMDLRMPVMDGLTAIRAIRAEESAAGWRRTPVIVLSANSSAQDRAASAAAGADDHVGKPFQAETLLAALEAAVETEGRRKAG